MKAAKILLQARTEAGLTQRQLAAMCGIKQPSIARIEAGRVSPTVETLSHLLAACGKRLTLTEQLGLGVDRSVMRRLLTLSPTHRLLLAVTESKNASMLDRAR